MAENRPAIGSVWKRGEAIYRVARIENNKVYLENENGRTLDYSGDGVTLWAFPYLYAPALILKTKKTK